MKTKYKMHITWKYYLVGALGLLIVGAGLTYAVLKGVSRWFDTHTITFNKVVTVVFKKPIEIKNREVQTQEIVRIIETIPAPEDLETDIEKYVYEVFGIENYRLALAIFKSESGLREDAVNIYNSNGTFDVGVAQINSGNFEIPGCSLKEVVVAKTNIDCAYIIWDRADGAEGNGRGKFTPWSAFNSGAFTAKLD